MARRSSSRREFSIPGDELEHNRIQLEQNLQNTDLSLHLSSVQDDDNESLEYPRHDSIPERFSGFASLDPHSRENIDLDVSQFRAWSINEDEGVAPYDVRTMSTVAHHASGVTITAGLARSGRREPSIGGAEYDPERPLQDIIAACRADSDGEGADRRLRPRLSETLHRVGFSPKRPRGSQHREPHEPHGMSDLSQRQADPRAPRRNMVSRARKPTVSFDTTATPIRRHVSQPAPIQPHVNIQPPTPSASGSRFTKMARGLAHDVRQAQEEWQEEDHPVSAAGHRTAIKSGLSRNDADMTGDPNHDSRAPKKSSARGRVHLPDITGLTNAVISPAKANLERYSVRGPSSKEVEGRLVASLNALHTRLNHLETENSIARRRVRELEYELEECKRDVLRERTRIVETQNTADLSAARIPVPSMSRAKGKERRHKDVDPHASKYFEVVQEKKALEALITTLRSHLARVTSDLSAQQQMLEELRSLRESDALSLTEKAQEINQLRTEVERLAGEIEVLRGVVEEGLNERRQGRDATIGHRNDHLPEMSAVDSTPLIESQEHLVRRFIDDEEIDRISVDLDERRSDRASNSSIQSACGGNESSSSSESCGSTSSPRIVRDTNVKLGGGSGGAGPNPPFPRINSERMERLFFSAPRHNATACRMCKGSHHLHHNHNEAGQDNHEPSKAIEEILERMDKNGGKLTPGDIPPQTVLARVVRELEEEFAHFREIYNGLTEEYKRLDCATQGAKRHVVGDQLQDAIEVLERKGNQIASLYDLLIFKDKPYEQ